MSLGMIKIEGDQNESNEDVDGEPGEMCHIAAQMVESEEDELTYEEEDIGGGNDSSDENGLLKRALTMKRDRGDGDPLQIPFKKSKNLYPTMSNDFEESIAAEERRSRNRMLNSYPTSTCPICGDRANGMHYCIFTCEGCKNFFKRSVAVINLDKPYVCKDQMQCDISVFESDGRTRRRTRCQYCRYQACLEAGMMHPSRSQVTNKSCPPVKIPILNETENVSQHFMANQDENFHAETNGQPLQNFMARHPQNGPTETYSTKYQDQINQLKSSRMEKEIEILKSRVKELETSVEEKSKQISLQKIQIENLTKECEYHEMNNCQIEEETGHNYTDHSSSIGFGSVTITSLGKRSSLKKKS